MRIQVCDQCRIETFTLIRSRTVTGQEINRCSACLNRMQDAQRERYAAVDVKKFRPKFFKSL